ncbi:unnamed protein product [Euphydryas editha]|uniref:FHA domain-containing protein n=1 Tax=Euphydryas editha TaxID=104508 RepID=A0AAU9UGY1_EUPED|nr:unnamed protein product [Euphydryas editha]
MSGGRLVVLDRLGRDVKAYPLEEGLATIGSDPACDIRVMMPQVSPHHATVVVHKYQTVVRSVAGATLVNGAPVSVAALRHRDVLTVGGRALRWEYSEQRPRPLAPQPALVRRVARARSRRRGSEPAARAVLQPAQRASMPASSGEKQVAIVQPQRRDNTEKIASRSNSKIRNKHSRTSRNDEQDSGNEAQSSTRKAYPLCDTKASQWIESRRTPLRLTALRAAHRRRHASAAAAPASPAAAPAPARAASASPARAASASPARRLRAPARLDHTKRAAIMLITGHTPKSKQSPKSKGPSFVVKKPSPVRKTPKQKKQSPRKSPRTGPADTATPRRAGPSSPSGPSGDRSTSILEITDSDSRTLRASNSSVRSARPSALRSPVLPTPKKSALKDPSAKKSTRKTESIKFDLSNLESNAQDRSSDILFATDTTKDNSYTSASDDDMSLHYSDTSPTQSPSPRKSIHSRSNRILEKSLGSTFTPISPARDVENVDLTPESPRSKKSLRGSLIVQKALKKSDVESSRYSSRTTKSLSDESYDTSAQKVNSSPRASTRNLESYSVVDLVSIGSNESVRSVYNSAASNNTTVTFDTPQTAASRATNSNNPSLLGSSTPFLHKKSSPKHRLDNNRVSNITTRRSVSLTTPENSTKHTPFNSTRISRASRSRSRINDSDILLMDNEDEDASPKSSRRRKTALSSSVVRKNITETTTLTQSPLDGTITPTKRHSPEEVTTPVLSIQSLLDQSALSQSSSTSQTKTRARAVNLKRKTIGANVSQPKKIRTSIKSRSLNMSSRRSLRARKTSDSIIARNQTPIENQKVETPKSAVKLVHEGVKNKHSTSKKPTSKRHIIDNLDESDFVKQLFNSPVKRKLSQSMTEFSKKHLFDDDVPSRPTRKTTALTGRTPDNSVLNQSNTFTPEVFVSPLSTPESSPDFSRMKSLFALYTPEKELREVTPVKASMPTPRTRESVRKVCQSTRNNLSSDLSDGIKKLSPKYDACGLSGIVNLVKLSRKHRSPKNTLEDVWGVKNLFRKSPSNDLRRVSGVKRTLRVNSPRNDLTDVRGVMQMFRDQAIRNDLSDLSGVEELFNNRHDPCDLIRSYAKSKRVTDVNIKSKQTGRTRSLHDSICPITNNADEWRNDLTNRVYEITHDETLSHAELYMKLSNLIKEDIARELEIPEPHEIAAEMVRRHIELLRPDMRSRKTHSLVDPNWSEGSSEDGGEVDEDARRLPFKKRSLVDDNWSEGGSEGSSEGGGEGVEEARRLPLKKRSLVDDWSEGGSEGSSEGGAEGGEDARRLPLKKRSLVDGNRSEGGSEGSGEGGEGGESARRLPLKKRAVPHSTPVKGRVHVTLNASELGRVSPIAGAPSDSDRTTQLAKESPKKKPSKASATKVQVTAILEEVPKPSPRRTRTKVQKSPQQVRATRGRKTKNAPMTNAKKRRSSIVITKKQPVMSPKPDPKPDEKPKNKPGKVKESNESPKKTRASRQKPQVEETIKTPRRTRAKASLKTVSVKKPSPKPKPRSTRQAKKVPESVVTSNEVKETRRGKRTVNKKSVENKTEESIHMQVKRTGKTTNENNSKTKGRKAHVEVEAPAQRSRKTVQVIGASDKSQNKKSRGAQDKISKQVSMESEPVRQTRGRKTKDTIVVPETNKRQKKANVVDDPKPAEISNVGVATRTSRRVTKVVKNVETGLKTETKTINKKRVTKAKENVQVKTVNKKDASNKSDSKEGKRGRNVSDKIVEIVQEIGRRNTKTALKQNIGAKPVRGKKITVVVEEISKPTRKRKTKAEEASAIQGMFKSSKLYLFPPYLAYEL